MATDSDLRYGHTMRTEQPCGKCGRETAGWLIEARDWWVCMACFRELTRRWWVTKTEFVGMPDAHWETRPVAGGVGYKVVVCEGGEGCGRLRG